MGKAVSQNADLLADSQIGVGIETGAADFADNTDISWGSTEGNKENKGVRSEPELFVSFRAVGFTEPEALVCFCLLSRVEPRMALTFSDGSTEGNEGDKRFLTKPELFVCFCS